MKPREYLFWIVLSLGTLLFGHWLTTPAASPPPHHQASFWDRATYWYAVWRLATNAPRPREFPRPIERQSLPDEVVNAQPQRKLGPDGQPLLDHSAGW